eukprot:TRINITY_DN52728_c0_g1_i3.p2 TRINITY_DN52728_c0_g1~~TRINITY_DN52728_c0_g1_i3.p2  ORF type:complete len:384 (-),score=30.53 TRINITY_DN52728_c0_g1_i3:15-1100(-)
MFTTMLIVIISLVLVLLNICDAQDIDSSGGVKLRDGNVISTNDTTANAGNFRGIQNVTEDIRQNNAAINNTASSISGLANAGDRTFFAGGESLGLVNINFASSNTAVNNVADSKLNSAISGTQMVANKVNSSTFVENSVARNNEARVFGRRSEYEPYAIAGSQTLINRVIRESEINLTNSAQGNEAVNGLQGMALSGVQRSLGNVRTSKVQLKSNSTQNKATSEYGQAIAGTVNGMYAAIRSDVDSTSEARENYAQSQGGDAISGVQNNVHLIKGTFSFAPEDQPTLTLNDTAYDNTAIAKSYGKAISGVQNNIRDVIGGYVVVNATSMNNIAITDGYDEDPEKEHEKRLLLLRKAAGAQN